MICCSGRSTPAIAWLAVTAITVTVTSARPGTGVRPLRTVDLALEFTWLASMAIAVLLGAGLAWRALAGTDITDAVIRPSASPPPWRRSRWPRA